MSFDDVFTMLDSIPGFSGKVAYRSFPEKEAPALPYICYMEDETDNVFADDEVYVEKSAFTIELYEDARDRATEKLIENTLNTNHFTWNRIPDWIETEKMWMISYEIEV